MAKSCEKALLSSAAVRLGWVKSQNPQKSPFSCVFWLSYATAGGLYYGDYIILDTHVCVFGGTSNEVSN